MGRLSTRGKRDLSVSLAAWDLPPLAREMPRLVIWSHASMTEAVAAGWRTRTRYYAVTGDKKQRMREAGERAITGEPYRLATALADSDALIADALAADPRLARRSQWVRGEEGELVCPALLSQGDDSPCFYRRRALVGQPNGAEPVKIVISTDSHEIRPRTAAAFIATCRLVQQYRPLEVYWQGSWLGAGRTTGWVFHVPLVSGDMDFARLEFCIADGCRDNLSWSIMATHACEEDHCSWNGHSLQAERSYLPASWEETVHFVSHRGIYPEAESIAAHAAQWLGWDSLWRIRMTEEKATQGALQELPKPRLVPRAETEEERIARERRWREFDERARQEQTTAAQGRAEKIGCFTTT